MGIKIKPADQWFSRCVRLAANWTCERCGTQYEENSTGVHNSHIFSRRHRTIRWAAANTQCLCYSCHQWFGGNPADSGYWVTNLLGIGHMELLREQRDSRVKVSKIEEKEIGKWYKAEYERMLATGDRNFESYQ